MRKVTSRSRPALPRQRPMPPEWVASHIERHRFEPAPDVAEWIRATFIAPGGRLANEEHLHLLHATIGVLWTNVPHRRQMRWVLATAEQPTNTGGPWKKGRYEQQLEEWFGSVPDFVITLYAPELAKASDRSFCAIVEHELYHCAHATTDTGAPRFHDDGSPIFGIRGHDVEEFTGVVRRYGSTPAVHALVAAAIEAAEVDEAQLDGACGTCRSPLLKVA